MQNWYCLVHFPDGTESVHLVPGPAPVRDQPIVKIVGRPGTWLVRDITTHVASQDYAAEIWVDPVEVEDQTQTP
jgi:hypothetical protein